MSIEKDMPRPSTLSLIRSAGNGAISISPSDALRSEEGHKAYEKLKTARGWDKKYSNVKIEPASSRTEK